METSSFVDMQSIYDQKMQTIRNTFDYEFKDIELMMKAITRRDHIEKTVGNGISKKDPLATLGDSVIRTIVLKRLIIQNFETAGDVSEEIKKYISGISQSNKAKSNHLVDLFIWSSNEQSMRVWEQDKPLGECLEALIGGIFFECGSIEKCEHALEKIKFFST
jgi:ribonuclease III